MTLTILMTFHQSPVNAAFNLVSLLFSVIGWILVIALVRVRPKRHRIAVET